MSIAPGAAPAPRPRRAGSTGLSYKFQRLRERIRQAVESGELSGKLPGERELAKRFDANPKTLSKALTDLAAEGLLERSIGRGTYTRGSVPASSLGRWLILCDPAEVSSLLVRELAAINPDSQTATDVAGMRPSFKRQFSAVIDMQAGTPEAFHRDMLVRGAPVVVIGREPRVYKTHAVALDRAHAAFSLARRMLLAGHRRLAAVEKGEDKTISTGLLLAVGRYAPDAQVLSFDPRWQTDMAVGDPTAIVCDGTSAAREIRRQLESAGRRVGEQIALAAVGCSDGEPPCSGYFVDPRQIADAVAELLHEGQVNQPMALWLTGSFLDGGTMCSVREPLEALPIETVSATA